MTNLNDLDIYTIPAGDKWLAATNRSPYFCFEAATQAEAHAKAKRALALLESVATPVTGSNGGREKASIGWRKMPARDLVAA